ncbi:MAG: hypothetical protein OEZ13_05025 [Spirochaetia bacterium]|nr:hypothetical protein [Spirochaetia bacterium]
MYKKITIYLIFFLASFSVYAEEHDKENNAENAKNIGIAEKAEEEKEEKEEKRKDNGYLFSGVKAKGGGGSSFIFYSFGPHLKSNLFLGAKGYLNLGKNIRLGGMGVGMTKFGTQKNALGFGGLWAQFLLRFDPLIIGPGFMIGAGGRSENSDMASDDERKEEGFFAAHVHFDIELRLFKAISMSVTTGYTALAFPDKSKNNYGANAGFAFNFGVF